MQKRKTSVGREMMRETEKRSVDAGKMSVCEEKEGGEKYSRGVPFPTHLLYANEILVFYLATKANALTILNILDYYGSISRQLVSSGKSQLIFSEKVYVHLRRSISQVLHFATGSLPFTYLGIPIFCGKVQASHLRSIHDKILNKFARWKGMQLSMAGRICLVKSVIQSSITHSMMVYQWPRSHLKELDMTWRMIGARTFGYSLLHGRYFTASCQVKQQALPPSVWYGDRQEIGDLVLNSYSYIEDGSSTLFWVDDWLGYKLSNKCGIPYFMIDSLG
ncbi:uncharacterized protein LOC131004582 [Salvia miltiorrhiza]|uniref:uncharacterized protein LOC131004582 n=1 Tax=Salvia miltiorrhiza TaxID=226208 RepID=UPI0025AC8D63|nr:uncharacterized protein LOC131004582 [Salvia miltiorrhiza]